MCTQHGVRRDRDSSGVWQSVWGRCVPTVRASRTDTAGHDTRDTCVVHVRRVSVVCVVVDGGEGRYVHLFLTLLKAVLCASGNCLKRVNQHKLLTGRGAGAGSHNEHGWSRVRVRVRAPAQLWAIDARC